MRLSDINSGDTIEIISLPDPIIRAQAIRLGIYQGAIVKCSQKINKGPVILKNRLQEIAIGYGLSASILVKIIKNPQHLKYSHKNHSFSYGYNR